MFCVTSAALFQIGLILITLVDYLYAVDLKRWGTVKNIPLWYSQISTQNILRCEKLCERQGKCMAVTFDKLNMICYLHDSTTAISTNYTQDVTSGQYLIKIYQASASDSTCDQHTELSLPAVRNQDGSCKSLKGLIGQSCAPEDKCTVDHSECRVDGTCGCLAGYSFKRSTHTCEADCGEYGNTFQIFPNHALFGFDALRKSNTSLDECQRLCIEATEYTCVSIDFNFSDAVCYHNKDNIDALFDPSSYRGHTKSHYFQRNCA